MGRRNRARSRRRRRSGPLPVVEFVVQRCGHADCGNTDVFERMREDKGGLVQRFMGCRACGRNFWQLRIDRKILMDSRIAAAGQSREYAGMIGPDTIELFSLPAVCSLLQVLPGRVRSAATKFHIEPRFILDGQPLYAAVDVERIRAAIVGTQQLPDPRLLNLEAGLQHL